MNLIRYFRSVFDFFIFSSLFIALCAILMVYQTSLLFQLPFNWNLAAFVGGGTICSYNFHWFLTPPAIEHPSKKLKWNISHRNMHLFLSLAGLITAAIFSFTLLNHWPWLVFAGLITFLYSAPKIAHPFFISLRKIAIAKTIYLALVWTIITVLLPIVFEEPLTKPALLFFINRFFFIYAICILFDYRDVESDRKAGIKSLITYFNEKGIHWLFWTSIVIALLTQLSLWRYFDQLDSIALTLPLLVLCFLYKRAKQNFSDYLYYFVLDGLMMLSLPLLVLAKFVR